MRQVFVWVTLVAAALPGTACERTPTTFPDLSDYTVPHVRYMCRGWYEGYRPNVEKGLFDVYFRADDESKPATVDQLDQVHDAGGIIIHKFNAPVVRTLISVDSLEALVDRNWHAWGAPDADAKTVELEGWTRTKLTEENRDFLISLGVVIGLEFDFAGGTALGVIVPDEHLPEIWSWDQWYSIGISDYGCSASYE